MTKTELQLSNHSQYPYIPGEKGVNFSWLKPVTTDNVIIQTITAASGHELVVEQERTRLWVRDNHDDRYVMGAVVDEQDIAYFNLRTKTSPASQPEQPAVYHPDFFAAHFITFALAYFQTCSVSVTACGGLWYEWTENYSTFQEALKAGYSKAESARKTWSGQRFIENGYGQIQNEDVINRMDADRVYYVEALFYKTPDQFS